MSLLTVSQLNEQIKSLLESTFMQVRLEGEVSRVTYHTSGHLYFTVKDEKSALSCVMFRSNAARLPFRLEEGMHIVLFGAVTVYVPRGNYQLMVQSIEPYGEGALSLAFEQLKKRLAAEGLFDPKRKKPLPSSVRHVVLVTSKTGAAVQDMIRVAAKRWPLVRLTVVDTLVQGAAAAREIARHIAYADMLGADVMVVGRGGGSREDLWAFNEEAVARAIAACQTPVVSAVGHEVDTLISDFVADVRAPTPSAAMEMILPDRFEVLMALDERADRLKARMAQILAHKGEGLAHLRKRLQRHAISARLQRRESEIVLAAVRLQNRIRQVLRQKEAAYGPLVSRLGATEHHLLSERRRFLQAQFQRLEGLDPTKRLPAGTVQLVRDDRVASLADLAPGQKVRLEDGKRVAEATIDAISEIS